MNEKLQYALRPDAEAFDEIRLKIIPRYKTSGLSGNEWRTSTVIEFYRKGIKVHQDGVGDMKTACGSLYWKALEAVEIHGKGWFIGDGIHCDQEGCSNKAQYLYKLKAEYCVGGGNCGAKKEKYNDSYRCFCNQHKTRGDSDLEDNDENYELINIIP